MSIGDYLSLLDWTARQIVRGKRGSTPKNAPPVFERLGIDAAAWSALVLDFGRMFWTVAGRPKTVDATRSKVHQHRFKLGSKTRTLLASLN